MLFRFVSAEPRQELLVLYFIFWLPRLGIKPAPQLWQRWILNVLHQKGTSCLFLVFLVFIFMVTLHVEVRWPGTESEPQSQQPWVLGWGSNANLCNNPCLCRRILNRCTVVGMPIFFLKSIFFLCTHLPFVFLIITALCVRLCLTLFYPCRHQTQ